MTPPEPAETPLESLGALSPASLDKLKGLWITTVEQLVAQAATPEGKERLAGLLELDQAAVGELVATAKAALDPATVKQLEAQHPDDKGMGALKPPG